MRSNAIYKLGAAICVFCSLAVALTGCGGGGGGGGGGSATVTGTVLSVETGLPDTTGATVKIGGQTATTDATGKFTLSNVAAGSQTGTISVSDSTELPLTFTTFPLKANTTNDLGTLYLSNAGYTASVTGRVVATVNGVTTPVGNATVTIANATTQSATNGTFTLSNLPVGLGATSGLVGKISASGFADKALTSDNLGFALVAGSNNIGDQLLAQPSGSVPSAPYTIKGVVTAGGAPAVGASVSLASNGISLGSTSTDATGTYTFWVVPATYTITAAVTGSTTTRTATVTLTALDKPVTVPTIAFP